MAAPLFREICLPSHFERIMASPEGYAEYLQAVYSTMCEAGSFIDWNVLEENGLPQLEIRKSATSVLKADLLAQSGGIVIESIPGNPSILPTLGVSIGMLFALGEGVRAARRMAKMATRSPSGISEGGRTFAKYRITGSNALRSDLVKWVDSLELSQGDKDEARFAAKACVEFARRHFQA